MLRPSRARKLCPEIPSLEVIRRKGEGFFGCRPCLWQAELDQAILDGTKDVVAVSGTGSGKTLTFWLPLLFCPEGIQIVITPLNILGAQNRDQLEAKGISAIAIDAQNMSLEVMQNILTRKYRVIIDGDFVSHIISVVWDEAHCVSTWGKFRKEYAEAGRLRNLLVERVPYLVVSATFPEQIMKDVMSTLKMDHDRTKYIQRSNDRPNVYLSVHRIRHSLKSFKDLEFLVPKNWKSGDKTPKFLIFFDSIQESVDAVKSLWPKMPSEIRNRLVWFNSDMTKQYCELTTRQFKGDDGPCCLGCTDSFGLGVDIPDIGFVGQWRATCDMDTLWQRFGRVGCGPGTEGVAVLFAEGKHFDDMKEKAALAAEAKKKAQEARASEAEKRKRGLNAAGSRKRARTDNSPALPPSTDNNEERNSLAVIDSLSVHEELRVQYRQSLADQKQKQSKTKKIAGNTAQLPPGIDNIINAATRPFNCHRVPIAAYYQNDRRLPDHSHCAPGIPAGCGRCNLIMSTTCCNLCNAKSDHPSDIFTRFIPPPPDMASEAPPVRPVTTRVSRLSKFDATTSDYALRKKLDDFRCARMQEQYGYAIALNLGPTEIMSDEDLERIASCARSKKIGSVEDIQREAPKWRRAQEYAGSVLELLQRHYPITDLYAVMPLHQRQLTTPLDASINRNLQAGAKKTMTCGACKRQGHTPLHRTEY
ncbi:P-loop containing nucleoside triphosphate hydrolase protein [Cytidiella melzeri]|nr:P-loop containing nucleoside triphosphate hydrolase protein [Cytidiella melzeri]